jgi:hypothetical protein
MSSSLPVRPIRLFVSLSSLSISLFSLSPNGERSNEVDEATGAAEVADLPAAFSFRLPPSSEAGASLARDPEAQP